MDLRLVSLVLVVVAFLGLLIWAYWPANRTRFERLGKSVLDEKPLEDRKV